MSRIGVVVPVFNVADYLEACLSSIAAQTYADLDVVVVDDGSTDDSAEIAARFCDRDRRFRLVQQPNGGLGQARNNGMALVDADLLAFVDSDDLLPPKAYELLTGALEDSRSDFATGGFRRIDATGVRPAHFAVEAFARTRTEEHIRRFHPLVIDRTAWNKVFRRSFWDAHAFRFAEGVTYEDQYATLPAHFLARSVEVVSPPVYFWRIRDDGGSSITQGRATATAIRDRVTAIRWTSRWLADRGLDDDKRWYDASVFVQDLVYVPDALADADGSDVDRTELVALVDAFLAEVDPSAYDGLPAVDRLSWHLVRAHDWDRLRDVLRFTPAVRGRARPVRRGLHWYVDAPRSGDRDLPEDLFRIDDEIDVVSRVAGITVDGGRLRIQGAACLTWLGADSPDAQTLRLRAVDDADRTVAFEVEPVARPDLAAVDPPVATATDWAGYVATLDLDLLVAGPAEPVTWRVAADVESQGVSRTTERHAAARLCPLRGATATVADGRQLRAELAGDRLSLHLEPPGPLITDARVEGSTLRLDGVANGLGGSSGWLRLNGSVDKRSRWPVEVGRGDDRSFTVRLPLAELSSDLDLPTAPQTIRRQAMDVWDLTLRIGRRPQRPVVAPAIRGAEWLVVAGRSWVLSTNRSGTAVLVERLPRPVFDGVMVDPDGSVVLTGPGPDEWPAGTLMLSNSDGRTEPLRREPGAATVRLPPPSPRADATVWDVVVRLEDGDGRTVPCAFAESVLPQLPHTGAGGAVVVGVRGRDGPAVYR